MKETDSKTWETIIIKKDQTQIEIVEERQPEKPQVPKSPIFESNSTLNGYQIKILVDKNTFMQQYQATKN